MAALTATTLTHTTAVTWPSSPGVAAAASGGDTVPNGGSTILVMNNTTAGAETVTVSTTATVDGLPVEDREFTVPANTIQLVKLGSVSVYGSSTRVDASATGVHLAAYAL